VRVGRAEPGGVAFSATTRQLYAANLWLRVASRVVVRRAAFHADAFDELERRVRALPWDDWLAVGAHPVFRVTATKSRLYHTDAVAERFARIVGPGDRDGPEQLVVVRLVADRATISVDSSGERLHRRGWRLQTAKAPLRETLAAAVLAASGWSIDQPLVDPLCGSGTLAIEAALAARDLAPGAGREFAFQRWPSFQPGTWASVSGEARRRARAPRSAPVIVAADRDAGAVEACRANAERAAVADDLVVHRAPLSAFAVPEGTPPGWVVTNPPYGQRVQGGGDLRDLYATLGRVVRDRLPGWSAALLVADPALARQTGLPLESRLRTTNGGVPVQVLATVTPGSAASGGR
jgi:putative N6-adenine-specific DNA methylase